MAEGAYGAKCAIDMGEEMARVKGKTGSGKEPVEKLVTFKEHGAVDGYVVVILLGSGWVKVRKQQKRTKKKLSAYQSRRAQRGVLYTGCIGC